MRKLSFFTLAALLCSGLALAACKGGNKGSAASAPAGKDDYIAKTIFELIPKEDLPDYCAHVEEMDWSQYDPADVPEFDPTFFSGNVEGHNVEGMDSGFYGYVNVKCYPLKGGGWRAYWAAYGGYDGLCGFDRSGAYNYVKGKLTKEEVWLLPTPDKTDLVDAELYDELTESGEWDYIDYPRANYNYAFGSGEDGLLTVSLDLDYLFYPEEGSDGAYSGEGLEVDYGWNGQRLVRQDFDALDDVQMNAIVKMLGFRPEQVVYEDGGFDIIDPEEEEEARTNYYHFVRIYPELDELGMATSWKVFDYEVGMRELKAYDFDGYNLKPSKHMIVDDWNAVKADNDYAGIWMSSVAIRFYADDEEGFDHPLGGYTYDPSCDGLFEPDEVFESQLD